MNRPNPDIQSKPKQTTLVVLLTATTLVLTGVAVFTAMKLKQSSTEPIAPNVPQSKPQAAIEATPTLPVGDDPFNPDSLFGDSCILEFTIGEITETPTETPTGTITTTPTNTPTNTPTSTPTGTITTTPTPKPGCNDTCDMANDQCTNDYVCTSGYCRNSDCPSESDCDCSVATSTPIPTTTVAPLPDAGIDLPLTLGLAVGFIITLLGALLLIL